ncbi:MAG TPA: hypothetical protein VNK04_07460 [Gemmataceae bacterium]|nr:hypothetical protein [Gemmataceae bacterium]
MIRPASRPRRYGPAIILLFTAFLAGCGSGLYPVEGQIVWKDGAPAKELAGSLVIFELPEKQTSARGVIQPDGSFRLTTNKPDDGAPAGEYKVLLIEVGRKPQGGADASVLAPGVIDTRYSDLSTSDLQATVRPGTNKITLTIERNPRR